MSNIPFNFSEISERYKNKNLPKPMIAFKYIGQAGFIIFVLSFIIKQANAEATGGVLFLDTLSTIGVSGFGLGILCLIIVSLYVMGVKNTFTKIFLYMFLPAIILTAILTIIFVLPQQ